MPTIRTGNQEWDQNLSTLGSALFPDPSKAAHAYYYGSEARKAQLEAAKTQDQMAAGHTALGMQFGRVPNPTYQPGFGGTQIMVDPNSQAQAPAPAAPPVPGTGTGLGAAVTAMPPQALGSAIVAGIENNAQSGTLPPMAPPAATSPPAPTTTASNGTTPSNSPARMHPASVTSAGGGGVMMAGPAAPDGTPAPSSFNMGQLIALQIQAGATPEAAYATARGTLGNMVKNGQIALPLAEQMAAFYGAPQMRVQDLSNQGALAVGAQTQAGETARNTARIAGDMARQQLVTGEARRADEFAPEKTVDAEGNAIFVSRRDTPGKRSYDPTLANTVAGLQNASVLIQPGGPGTQPRSTTAIQAQTTGAPIYQAGTEDILQTQQGAVGVYTSKADPSTRVLMTARAAMAGGFSPTPASQDQYDAFLQDAIRRTTDPAELEHLNRLRLQAAALPKGPVTGEQAFQQAAVNYATDQQAYPQPDPYTAVDVTVKDPVALTDKAETAVRDRTRAVKLTARGYTLNDTEARNEARRQLQDEGVLYTPDEINKMRADGMRSWVGRDVRIQNYTPPGQASSPHMMVGLKPKPGSAEATTTPPVSTVMTPQQMYGGTRTGPPPTSAAPTGPPPGATGKLPAGTPDGPFRLNTGEVGTAVGGYFIPSR